MKIKRLLFTLLSFLFLITACDFFNGEEGLVVLRLGSSSTNSRALNSDGLPIIEDTDIKIIAINKSTGEKMEKSVGSETSPSISLPIGESFIIKVKINNEIGIWCGETEHTVSSGTNEVNIKIKRNACGFRPIGFTVDSGMKYTLYTPSGNPIMDASGVPELGAEVGLPPIFCPNNKGGLYLHSITSNSTFSIASSEGEFISSSTSVPINIPMLDLAYDYNTGISYLVVSDGGGSNRRLKTINIGTSASDNGKVILDDDKPLPLVYTGASVDSIAVYNDLVFTMSTRKPQQLKVYKDGIDLTEVSNNFYATVTGSSLNNEVYDYTKFDATFKKITDIFADEKYVYILFFANGGESSPAPPPLINLAPSVTVGGILKIKYEFDGSNINFSNPQIFGLGSLSSIPPSGILPEEYYANHFYNPIKFVGFDGDNLYIADDGAYNDGGSPMGAESNRNRMAIFNLENESLSFVDVPDSVKWVKEIP